MKALTAAVVLALSGCSTSPVYEVAAGFNATQYMPWSEGSGGGFDGPRDVVRFTVRQESRNGKRFCGYSHISHVSAGFPFNDQHEDWLDMVECGVRIGGEQ